MTVKAVAPAPAGPTKPSAQEELERQRLAPPEHPARDLPSLSPGEVVGRYVVIDLLGSAGKVWIQTHFNHAREVTPEAARVCNALLRAGMPVNNHTVLMKDVNEFLAGIELNPRMGRVPITVTYQDSCHLAHGQRIRTQPRKLLRAVPGLTFREMPMSDLCCGSAGIYNVVQNEMAMSVLRSKMDYVNMTGAEVIVTANPGCMLQLQAGSRMHGKGQRVAHVVEILDEAYCGFKE